MKDQDHCLASQLPQSSIIIVTGSSLASNIKNFEVVTGPFPVTKEMSEYKLLSYSYRPTLCVT